MYNKWTEKAIVILVKEGESRSSAISRLEESLSEAKTANEMAIEVMSQKISHVYEGSCPDWLQPDSRDVGCPVCQLMMDMT